MHNEVFLKIRDFSVLFERHKASFGFPAQLNVIGQAEEERINSCVPIINSWLGTA
jgi:hypothetical protein